MTYNDLYIMNLATVEVVAAGEQLPFGRPSGPEPALGCDEAAQPAVLGAVCAGTVATLVSELLLAETRFIKETRKAAEIRTVRAEPFGILGLGKGSGKAAGDG